MASSKTRSAVSSSAIALIALLIALSLGVAAADGTEQPASTVDCDALSKNNSSSGGKNVSSSSCFEQYPHCRYDTVTENCVFLFCSHYGNDKRACERSSKCVFNSGSDKCEAKPCHTFLMSTDCVEEEPSNSSSASPYPPTLCRWDSAKETCAHRSCYAFDSLPLYCAELLPQCGYDSVTSVCARQTCADITSRAACSAMLAHSDSDADRRCVWMFGACTEGKCFGSGAANASACAAVGDECAWIPSSDSTSSDGGVSWVCFDDTVLKQPCDAYGNNSEMCWAASSIGRCRMLNDTNSNSSNSSDVRCVTTSVAAEDGCFYRDSSYDILLPDHNSNTGSNLDSLVQCPAQYCHRQYNLCFNKGSFCAHLSASATACTNPGGVQKQFPSSCEWLASTASSSSECSDRARNYMPCQAYKSSSDCPNWRCTWSNDTSSEQGAGGACAAQSSEVFISTLTEVDQRGAGCDRCEEEFCVCMGGAYDAPPSGSNATNRTTPSPTSPSFFAPLASCLAIPFLTEINASSSSSSNLCQSYLYNVSNCTKKFLACKISVSMHTMEEEATKSRQSSDSETATTRTEVCKLWHTQLHLQALDATATLISHFKQTNSYNAAGSALVVRNTTIFDNCYAAAESIYRDAFVHNDKVRNSGDSGCAALLAPLFASSSSSSQQQQQQRVEEGEAASSLALLSPSVACFAAIRMSIVPNATAPTTAATPTPSTATPSPEHQQQPLTVSNNVTFELNETLARKGYTRAGGVHGNSATIHEILKFYTLPTLVSSVSALFDSSFVLDDVMGKIISSSFSSFLPEQERWVRAAINTRAILLRRSSAMKSTSAVWRSKGTVNRYGVVTSSSTSATYTTSVFNFSIDAVTVEAEDVATGNNENFHPRIRVAIAVSYFPNKEDVAHVDVASSASAPASRSAPAGGQYSEDEYQSTVDYLVQLLGDWVYSPLTCPYILCQQLGLALTPPSSSTSSSSSVENGGASPPENLVLTSLVGGSGTSVEMWLFLVVIMGSIAVGVMTGHFVVTRALSGGGGGGEKGGKRPSLADRLLGDVAQV